MIRNFGTGDIQMGCYRIEFIEDYSDFIEKWNVEKLSKETNKHIDIFTENYVEEPFSMDYLIVNNVYNQSKRFHIYNSSDISTKCYYINLDTSNIKNALNLSLYVPTNIMSNDSMNLMLTTAKQLLSSLGNILNSQNEIIKTKVLDNYEKNNGKNNISLLQKERFEQCLIGISNFLPRESREFYLDYISELIDECECSGRSYTYTKSLCYWHLTTLIIGLILDLVRSFIPLLNSISEKKEKNK